MRNNILSIFMLVLVLMASGCTLDSFMFNLEKQDGPYDFSDSSIPTDKFDAEGTFITAQDGTRIHLHVVESSGASPDRSSTTILYCHGNSSNISHYWDRVEGFYAMGFRTLIFDYRGYGRSEGEPTEPGVYMDSEAALSHLLDMPQTEPERIVFYGNSLGAAVCIELAYRHSDQPAVLIVVAPFRSVADLVQDGAGASLHPGFITNLRFNNYAKIDQVGAPLMVIHGQDDDYLMPQYGKDLFERALPPKELWLVPGAEHGNVPGDAGTERNEEYKKRVSGFIDRHIDTP